MKLFIKPHNDTAWEFYKNHGHFHDGDAGLDLYVLEDIHFAEGETKTIKLGISCEPEVEFIPTFINRSQSLEQVRGRREPGGTPIYIYMYIQGGSPPAHAAPGPATMISTCTFQATVSTFVKVMCLFLETVCD